MKTYELQYYDQDPWYKSIGILDNASKCVGCIFSSGNITTASIVGKFTDLIKCRSALINNDFKIIKYEVINNV